MHAEQIVDNFGAVFALESLAVDFEQLVELFRRRITDFNLVRDSPQERFVHQIGWLEVRREDNQLFKRDLDFLAGSQRQKVNTTLQWHDPAIQ